MQINNGAKELQSRPKRVFFFSPLYLPFITLHSLFFFARLQGLKKALKFSEIKIQFNSGS